MANEKPTTVTDNIDEQLKRLQLARLLREEKDLEAKVQLEKAAREQGARQQEEQRKRQEDLQKACPHRKENGQTALAGQFDHNNKRILICQFCQKVWNEGDPNPEPVPYYLMPPDSHIGGPLRGASV